MKTFIGIDLGTSAAKFLLVDAEGIILARHSESYSVSYPKEGWSEQSPDDWLGAAERGVAALLDGQDRGSVAGISFGGQMHGLVMLDENDAVIRPCILWNDGRTEKQTAYLNEVIGKEKLISLTANIAYAGFTAPKILWLKENEPENLARTRKIMLPKDYLVYMLTGTHCTDPSDASGTLLFDVKNGRWSQKMCDICGISTNVLPKVYKSYAPVGRLKERYCRLWGLSDVTVAAGAGDNAAAAVGTGTVNDGDCNISLGTSGTVFISQDAFRADGSYALHSFAHANGKYHLMGCILSAAACNSWWMNVLKTDDYGAEQAGCERFIAENDVYFLPYLMGERCPHNDVNARGAFIGMTATTSREQLTLAVLEGVIFALKDCIVRAQACGTKINKTRICGGGAKSALWRKLAADILGIPVEVPAVDEGPAYGAAILAMVACRQYPDIKTAAAKLVKIKSIQYPNATAVTAYSEKYKKFTMLYPALKDVFTKL